MRTNEEILENFCKIIAEDIKELAIKLAEFHCEFMENRPSYSEFVADDS